MGSLEAIFLTAHKTNSSVSNAAQKHFDKVSQQDPKDVPTYGVRNHFSHACVVSRIHVQAAINYRNYR